MAQWGAYGFAQQGATYDEILAHYYHGHDARPGAGERACACCSRRAVAADRLLAGSVHGARRPRPALAPRRRGADRSAPAFGSRRPTSSSRSSSRARSPFCPARRRSASAAGPTAAIPGLRGRRLCAPSTTSALEAYLFGVVPSEMPQRLASGGAQGAGRRGTLLRARRPQDRLLVRPLPRTLAARSTAASRTRKPSTTAAVQATAGPGRPLPGPARDDVFLLELRRADSVGARGLAGSQPTPYLVSSTTPTTRSLPITAGARSSSPPPGSARHCGLRGACSTSARTRARRDASRR